MQITIKGIIRHQSLLKASAARKANGQEYDKKHYSVNVLVADNDPQIATIKQAVQSGVLKAFPDGNLPAGANVVFKDSGITGYQELRATSSGDFDRPQVVHHDNAFTPVIDPAEIKIGDLVWLSCTTASYTTGDGGQACYLNATMITGEVGPIQIDQLSSRPTAQALFSGVGGAAPAPMAPAPMAPAPMAPAPMAPAPIAPAPIAPPLPAAIPPAAIHQLTELAGGASYEAMISAGWTDVTLIEQGMMLPPGGVTPSFM